ncbi:ABC transporter ATP-binding protein [Mesorhizobium sp. AR07]|nr:ABC transporter ATP-binding protein [Mesorhizobium sp. AR07]
MAERPTTSRETSGKAARAVLRIDDLQVFYGESHALQGVSLTLESGVLSVVGRNGMGKSTLCNAIVGLKRAKSGSIRFDGREITSLEPHEIHRLGVGYVPQGRRVWPSLTVDEHLRLAAGNRRDASWTVERVYQTFPRLAERRGNGGSQLSGGEQQMLAISRALLSDPKLLVMDEPTEGLAPIIVDQVERMLVDLAAEGDMAVLVIEQNIGVATAVSNQVAIMVNGRINRLMDAKALAADRELQQRLLGVGRHAGGSTRHAGRSRAGKGTTGGSLSRRSHWRRRGRTDAAERRLSPGHRIAQPLERAGHRIAPGSGRQDHAAGRPEKGLRHPLCRAHRPHSAGRRHLRYQGQGTALRRRPAEVARHSGPHRRSVDIGKTDQRRRTGHAGGRHARTRIIGRLHQ